MLSCPRHAQLLNVNCKENVVFLSSSKKTAQTRPVLDCLIGIFVCCMFRCRDVGVFVLQRVWIRCVCVWVAVARAVLAVALLELCTPAKDTGTSKKKEDSFVCCGCVCVVAVVAPVERFAMFVSPRRDHNKKMRDSRSRVGAPKC